MLESRGRGESTHTVKPPLVSAEKQQGCQVQRLWTWTLPVLALPQTSCLGSPSPGPLMGDNNSTALVWWLWAPCEVMCSKGEALLKRPPLQSSPPLGNSLAAAVEAAAAASATKWIHFTTTPHPDLGGPHRCS